MGLDSMQKGLGLDREEVPFFFRINPKDVALCKVLFGYVFPRTSQDEENLALAVFGPGLTDTETRVVAIAATSSR